MSSASLSSSPTKRRASAAAVAAATAAFPVQSPDKKKLKSLDVNVDVSTAVSSNKNDDKSKKDEKGTGKNGKEAGARRFRQPLIGSYMNAAPSDNSRTNQEKKFFPLFVRENRTNEASRKHIVVKTVEFASTTSSNSRGGEETDKSQKDNTKSKTKEASTQHAVAKTVKVAITNSANSPGGQETDKITPYEKYFNDLDNFMKANEKTIQDLLLIRALNEDMEEDDDDYYEDEYVEGTAAARAKQDSYTVQDMNKLRYIMITTGRKKAMDTIKGLLVGDQRKGVEDFDMMMMMLNTSFSYKVKSTWDRVHALTTDPNVKPSVKLDHLIVLTYLLKEFDVWLYDNEGGMDVVTRGLANAWRKLLKGRNSSDQVLGWDIQYTKPGVYELLKQFQSEVNGADEDSHRGGLKGTFRYK